LEAKQFITICCHDAEKEPESTLLTEDKEKPTTWINYCYAFDERRKEQRTYFD